MPHAIRGGLVLGALVAAWTLVMGITGWYRHPTLATLFFLVVIMQIAVLVAVLRRTAREGRGWGRQVKVGLVTSLIASGVIFVNSLLFTAVLFPSYFEDLRAGQRQLLKNDGMSDEDVEKKIAEAAQSQTSIGQALAGVVGTMLTGLFGSAIIAIFVRHREDRPAS